MAFLRRAVDRVIGTRAWRAYEASLAARPLPTKMATSCTLMATGDILAQLVPQALSPPEPPAAGRGAAPPRWDPTQTAAMALCGLLGRAQGSAALSLCTATHAR